MKVLQVIDTLNVGGAEKIAVTLSNLLHEKGVHVSVLLIVKGGELMGQIHSDIKVYQLERKNKFSFNKIKQVATIIGNYDVVHVHLKHNYRYVKLASRLFAKKKVILHDHSHMLHISKSFNRKIKDFFFKNMLKPDLYIGVSEENCSWAKNVLKINENNVYKLTNIVAKETHKKDNIAKTKEAILVSNITRIKNISFALNVVKMADLDLTIYGKVYDQAYMDELNKEVTQLGLQDKVTFISNETNIQKILPQFKLGLLTSKKETGPLVVIEYLAQGLPFLAYETGEVIHTIKEELPECIMPSFNEKSWVTNIEKVKNLSSKKLEAIYAKYFSPAKYTDQCLEIYQKIKNS